jgi:DDE family transposase
MIPEQELRAKYEAIFPRLDERQRRVIAAADALFLGRGGVSRVSHASGLSRTTLHRGLAELHTQSQAETRIRHVGGGRKGVAEQDPTLLEALEALVEPLTRGEPMSPLRWTCKSTRQLAAALRQLGYHISHPTVARLLHDLGYSLQANVKTLEGASHPDRDAQFQYINMQVKKCLNRQRAVISVDTKKKELVGLYKNPGQEWRKTGNPRHVNLHDFPDKKLGKAVPDGVYDIGQNVGWVNVGGDNDTASFAIESLRRWWVHMGKPLYPKTRTLLICAASGGSNGYRVRLWKRELQRLANSLGLEVTVCHFPPGTSKWNKIEHRLFSHISMNWRGQPLISHEVIVELIGTTTTKGGLHVEAQLDTHTYPTKIKVSDEEMATLNIQPHAFHGEWNYTVKPIRP